MPDFPRQEAKIYQLANTMFDGIFAHMTDFPHASWFKIFNGILFYRNARNQCLYNRSQLHLANQAKRASFRHLKTIMKQCLKLSQVDTTDHPEKLALIGWAAPGRSSVAEPPNPPLNLTAHSCDKTGSLQLNWHKPAKGQQVLNYLIQRRNPNQGKWELMAIVYQSNSYLTGQPRGIDLEYRIIAVNKAGKGEPSNTVMAVL
ncbi:MAG: fibronectin type III domain-containing protein [Planctomycetes bacterium]|nr:fibronectin type III domain-containing protein [Planctomycetota bacterium]